jgi:hypothetical protein
MTGLTREDVIAVLGTVDEAVIARVVATEATLEELTLASAWLSNDEPLMGEGRPLPSGRVAQLVDLLSPREEEDGDGKPA